ncbi:potassium transporter [Marinitoga sp. 1135]|uniref:Putative K(+)-stimulated pyrophosphate-energized sodium pump n=1 Tax=Marinitoga piezophila (strain DSM 14283 / JCM 11233 / KA3) TaxID=443254 RepID=H2J5U2_MARPK|nr:MULTISPECIES: sodium-translocating pyrophosphatase [Marinitoga]AEX86161.1 vacuolar-type H(+)-translocating pyrophosphatase [Marinitoga piezophila KA3]APT76576.1 potassium transporter [Marinitoga sp. 1137]NUU96343.1 potassium transporter [Marinitoga sp. 1135]NUU98261.1 potassium transporter [Marinitoga sp. 1138]
MTILNLSGIVFGLVGIVFTIFLTFKVLENSPGNEKMQKISGAIQTGARAFLISEYKILYVIVGIIFILLGLTNGWMMALAFFLGATLSVLSGFFGMSIATKTNTRTAQGAIHSLSNGLKIAFNGGAIMGMTVASLGLFGLGLVFYLTNGDTISMSGYAMGASLVALFARVGGGIFTKAADVGADLVGKTEAGIPEDDPRNPAVIADNVGDNVGDVAGMGADLYESFVGSIFSASALGVILFSEKGATFPFIVVSIGIISAIIGILVFNFNLKDKENVDPSKALHFGMYIANILTLIGVFFLSLIFLKTLKPFYVIFLGMVVGMLIGSITEYYTAKEPVKHLAKSAVSGAAPLLINGMAVGMESTAIPVILISLATIVSYNLLGLFGIALAGVGMLATLGITLAIDAYGPIADNAGGIAQMAELEPYVRERTDALDAVGNTTAAIGKGFAIGSAALTALALFASYTKVVNLEIIDLAKSQVFIGALVGGMLPFLFSSMAMKAVGDAAEIMVEEVRRQFREIVGLMEGKADPDYSSCVAIATKGALKKMVLPSLLAVFMPIIMFFILGKEAVAGMLVGTTVSGVMLAIFMANSGGAWDNAKKYIETGEFGGKGSFAHKAAVIGDTVGDPFKDTAGPAINILIKLMSIVSIVVIPILIKIFQ